MTRDSNEEVLQCYFDVLHELRVAVAERDADDIARCERDLAELRRELTRRLSIRPDFDFPSENT